MQTVQPPINLENWIEENREKFKPPVSNRLLYDGRDFFVMVIKGPNARNDFHLVDSEEYFYQLKGDIKVRVREGDRIVDHIVKEGETFFIPPNVPHSPCWISGMTTPAVLARNAATKSRKRRRWNHCRASVSDALIGVSQKRPTIPP
jgi:3-hydroxyanthranilate 3,4-dioxygenase